MNAEQAFVFTVVAIIAIVSSFIIGMAIGKNMGQADSIRWDKRSNR